MEIKEIIGIDVSKLTLDWWSHRIQAGQVGFRSFVSR